VFSWGRIIPFVQNSPIELNVKSTACLELNVRSTACLELNVRSTVVNDRSKRFWHVVQQ
jgi:hypothetical protein